MHIQGMYRTIFETTGAATVIIEQDMTLGLVNSEFEKLSGYPRREIEGCKKLSDFVLAEDMHRMSAYHYARRQNPAAAPRNYEFRFRDRRGAVKNIYMTIAIIAETGQSVGSFLDITGHRQALQELSNSEERFRCLIEELHTGIFIVQNDRIVYANPEQERLFGPPPPEAKIANMKYIHPDDAEKVRTFHLGISAPDYKTSDIEFRYNVPENNVLAGMRWVHCRASRITHLGGPATLVQMMDITKTRELEHMLCVKDKMISLGHVAAGIAHEIRNPLSGINVYLDAIRENFPDPESADDIRDLIAQAKAAAGKIESVIKRVLGFVRSGPPRFETADVNKPIRDALSLSQVAMRKTDVQVMTDLAGDLPPICIDVQLIEQVVLNLINNASDVFTEKNGGGMIHIISARSGGSILIRVGDSGPGIPAADRRRVFDPFFTTKKEGSGIGLSMCQRIITEHKGTITVGTSSLGGAEFLIRLPIEQA